MVLFYDDKELDPPTGKRKYIRRAVKVLVAICILLSLSLWVLSSLGGNSNALRLGVQDYLTDTSGYLAEIETLQDMSFFPVSRFSFEKLSFNRPVKKETLPEEDKSGGSAAYPVQKTMNDFYDAGELVAHIEKGKASMYFWDMFLGRRRFTELEILGVTVNKGIWTPESISLESVKVVPDEHSPVIVGKGLYGRHKVDFRLGMGQLKTKSGIVTYQIPEETPIDVTIGPLKLAGVMMSAGSAAKLDIRTLSINDTVFTGSVVFRTERRGGSIKADIKTGNSHILADLSTSPVEVTGTLTAPELDIQDISSIHKAYSELKSILGIADKDEKISFSTRNVNLDLVISKLKHAEQEWGSTKAALAMKPYLLQINDIVGLLAGGALKGNFIVDASGKNSPYLKADMHLRGWDYARLQAQVTGQADTHLTLSSEGESFEELEKNLKGEFLTVAGKGELSDDSVLYWGSGLLNAMLPELSNQERLHMNCIVADFDVKGGHAEAQTLFMDLTDLTVVGEGIVNWKDMSLDLELKPQPKEISILDGGVAVSVKGPFSAPEIQPEKFSAGKKLGGLLLGSINPAFFALSLTDMGLNEKHPCYAYIK